LGVQTKAAKKMPELELPDLDKARKQIQAADDEEIEMALKYLYLICGRASEVVSEAYGGRSAYGPDGSVDFAEYEDEVSGAVYKVAVFSVKTAKRKGTIRKIALPLDSKYEPWTQGVADYFQKRAGKPVFPFTPQYLWRKSKPLFKGMKYPIDMYSIKTKEGELKTIEQHIRPCALHWIRHLRATELVSAPGYPKRFRFDVFELAYFGGWTIKGLMGMGMSGGAFQRYVNLPWESYFPKLLRPTA
jgi:hypothetical protein